MQIWVRAFILSCNWFLACILRLEIYYDSSNNFKRNSRILFTSFFSLQIFVSILSFLNFADLYIWYSVEEEVNCSFWSDEHPSILFTSANIWLVSLLLVSALQFHIVPKGVNDLLFSASECFESIFRMSWVYFKVLSVTSPDCQHLPYI